MIALVAAATITLFAGLAVGGSLKALFLLDDNRPVLASAVALSALFAASFVAVGGSWILADMT